MKRTLPDTGISDNTQIASVVWPQWYSNVFVPSLTINEASIYMFVSTEIAQNDSFTSEELERV